jgi:hypothetical protein
MSDATMEAINSDLDRGGLGGNPPFRSVGAALAKIGTVLHHHGYEWGEVINSHLFMRPKGRTAFDIDQSNPDDIFSPKPVRDVALAFTWHTFDTGRVEAIAYVSRGAPEPATKRTRRR